ncbi:MAG: aminotransferase class V-fold PLP-dependent enzyme [Proteobacteria bacterium]|nr:aminotransferase class V-fold PLP-dependent enzyme [Pseudomonadota bacterium]
MKIQLLEKAGSISDKESFARPADNWAYFDNAGGSFTLHEVIARTCDYMRSTPVQLGGIYPLSMEAASRQSRALGKLAGFVNAADATEIVLGSSSTALAWQTARAMRPLLREGDEIVITEMDHEANRSPWLWLKECGVTIRTWKLGADFALSLTHLDELLNNRTRLVCFSHCSNILGRMEPVAEITRRVHAAGARVYVDGVAYAPHRRVDVRAWDVDFYVFSLYKLFGPHIGMLYGKRDALLELGNINHEYLSSDALPYKLQPGGVSYELAWGATAIVDYFDKWRERDGIEPFETIGEYESELVRPLLEFLASRDDVTVLGPGTADAAVRLPIVSFRHSAISSATIANELVKRELAVRHGHFHSLRLLESLGLSAQDGVVRISLAHYNTREEMDRLLQALNEILPDK